MLQAEVLRFELLRRRADLLCPGRPGVQCRAELLRSRAELRLRIVVLRSSSSLLQAALLQATVLQRALLQAALLQDPLLRFELLRLN